MANRTTPSSLPPDAPLLHMISLGCPKNLVDAERMLARLALGGFVLTDDATLADVIVVNTCDFIAPATEESRAVIREAARLRRTGRCRRLVVVGCMAQRRGEALLEEFPEIDALVGVFERDRILEACRPSGEGVAGGVCLVGPPRPVGSDLERFRLTPRHTAYLRIAEGCDNRCSYCVIPSIRGPLRSKPIEMVLAEARELVADGARELNIIAQDTTAYGSDLGGGVHLVDLLRALESLEGVRWLRLLYTHPAHLDDRLIDFIADSPKMCHYIDLPLQHASDPVLRRMGRGVSSQQIRSLIERLRRRVPDIAIRTTFIVGFPGETEEDFARVLDLVRWARFERLGAFLYWPEEGTPASTLPDQVPREVAERRLHQLMSLQQRIVFEQNRSWVGRRVEVLVEGPSPRFRGRLLARSQAHAPEIDGGIHLRGRARPGTFPTVRITAFKDYDLLAEVEIPHPRPPSRAGSGRTETPKS